MKNLVNYSLALLLIINFYNIKVHALENEVSLNNSQIKISKKYAERYCSAKADHFFDGLGNEKTLKYSYFRYIGLQSEEIPSTDIVNILIKQIMEKCTITQEEESEIKIFLLKANK